MTTTPTQMYANANNTTTLHPIKRSSEPNVFHRHPRVPFAFDLHSNCDSLKLAHHLCSPLPTQTLYCEKDCNQVFPFSFQGQNHYGLV